VVFINEGKQTMNLFLNSFNTLITLNLLNLCLISRCLGL